MPFRLCRGVSVVFDVKQKICKLRPLNGSGDNLSNLIPYIYWTNCPLLTLVGDSLVEEVFEGGDWFGDAWVDVD